jgi:hypothetical protein
MFGFLMGHTSTWDGVVNKQNVQFWASDNPRVIYEKVHHAPRITVWVAISSHGHFAENITCHYLQPNPSTGVHLNTT